MSSGPHSSSGGRGAADRVRLSQAQARVTLRVALVFIVAAALAGAIGHTTWLPLHLFLAGAVVLAIGGVSLMLTVTWSAAPAPPNQWVVAQRTCIAVGAAGITIARSAELPDAIVGLAGAIYITGIVLLAGLLVVTIRRGVERRFDAAVAAFVAALSAGTVGAALGVVMAVAGPSPDLRSAHAVLNLLGLVGLVIGGTLPFFAATVVRARMSPRASVKRLALALGWQVAMLVLAASAVAAHRESLAAIGLGGYAVGIVGVLESLPRPTRRQLSWAGPRLVGLWAGGLWWVVAVGATAIDAASGRTVFDGRWMAVLVIAGYAQIMWASLAYLLPMLRGGGHVRLGEGFAMTRSWLGLVAANLAGVALAGSWMPVAAGCIAVWVLDSAWRVARVGTTQAARPTAD